MQKNLINLFLILFGFCLSFTSFMSSCNFKKAEEQNTNQNALTLMTPDIHSCAEPNLAKVTHLNLDLKVDFDKKILQGIAMLSISADPEAKRIMLDTRGLKIEKVLAADGTEIPFTLHPYVDSVFSEPLEVTLQPTTKKISIYYSTSPDAEAVQWLQPAQTAGKKHPFLFTQGQAILTRSWIPIQDSPGIRITYDARITTPDGLMAIMSAVNPTTTNDKNIYTFQQNKPIPAYLIALSVGNLVFKEVGPRTGVYAEPETIEKAATEFSEMEKMLEAAEKLYGKYAWERYDLVVLPPSFPFGGMENPRLTFATPTILAGDKSLTNLVAHELAHSWSGNLVTNATWNDFWLNEGFTVYFERRIMESLQGADYADMLAVLGYQDLQKTLADFGKDSPLTCLKLNLKGMNPDEGMNDIAYEKGFFLLKYMERKVGREAFDAFLNGYFSRQPFSSMTTEDFLKYLDAQLLSKHKDKISLDEVREWVYKPNLPANCPVPNSARFDAVDAAIKGFESGKTLSKKETEKWSTHEFLHFLRGLDSLTVSQMAALDKEFNFTNSTNSEIQFQWYLNAVNAAYEPAFANTRTFLINTGRRKFLTPIYKAIITKKGVEVARDIFMEAKPNYHFVAANTIGDLVR